jgi:hypothetical protein
MPGPLSGRIPGEFVVGQGLVTPVTARTGRGIQPLFADTLGTQTVVANEFLSITVPFPTLSANASVVLTAQQGFSVFPNIKLASFDLGRVMFLSPSYAPIPNGIIHTPSFMLTSNQGTSASGEFAQGGMYRNMSVVFSASLYATAAIATAGSIVVTVQAVLFGSAQGN